MQTINKSITINGHFDINEVIENIEQLLGVKLMARVIDDEVNGYINGNKTYNENNEPVTIFEVCLYQEDQKPTDLSVADEIIKDLPVDKQQKVKQKYILTTGGHLTKFKKAKVTKSKLDKLEITVQKMVK